MATYHDLARRCWILATQCLSRDEMYRFIFYSARIGLFNHALSNYFSADKSGTIDFLLNRVWFFMRQQSVQSSGYRRYVKFYSRLATGWHVCIIESSPLAKRFACDSANSIIRNLSTNWNAIRFSRVNSMFLSECNDRSPVTWIKSYYSSRSTVFREHRSPTHRISDSFSFRFLET